MPRKKISASTDGSSTSPINVFVVSMYSFSSESENGSSSLDPWTGKPRRTSNASDTNTESTTDRNDKCLLKNITLAREEDSDISDTNHLPGK